MKTGEEIEQIIKVLEDDYKKLQEDNRFTVEFLDGYYSCISDIKILAKNGLSYEHQNKTN